MPQLGRVLLAVAVLCSLGLIQTVHGRPRRSTKLIIFGDTVTDTGKAPGGFWLLKNKTLPRPDIYYQGRFTNAPGNWQDWLPDGLIPINYAVGGATACHYDGLGDQSTIIPTILQQVEYYTSTVKADPNSVPVIWMGHPADVLVMDRLPLDQRNDIPADCVKCLINATNLLLKHGSSKVILATSAALDLMPFITQQNQLVQNQTQETLEWINFAIKSAAKVLSQAYHYKGQKVVVWDAHKVMADTVKNARKLKFTMPNNSSCVVFPPTAVAPSMHGANATSVCKNPDSYVWFDNLHPSSAAYRILAQSLAKLV